MQVDGLDVLFAWIQVSDIHAGHGRPHYGHDQQIILNHLTSDVERFLERTSLTVDALFVTGDIAFSGNARQATEYDQAGVFLQDLAQRADLPAGRIMLVPGNHDATLAGSSALLEALLQQLRAGNRLLDDLDEESLRRLAERFANYSAFESTYRTSDWRPLGSFGHWERRLDPIGARGLPVRIVGFNTAVLTELADNERRMQIGLGPIRHMAAEPDGEIVIMLSHHPLTAEWLFDADKVTPLLEERVDLFLCGHVHDAGVGQLQRGTTASFVKMTSGAAHGDESEPIAHSYSLGAVASHEGSIGIAIWPRCYYVKKASFDAHTEVLPAGTEFTWAELPAAKQAIVQRWSRRAATQPREEDFLSEYVDDAVARIRAALTRITDPLLIGRRSIAVSEFLREVETLAAGHTREFARGEYYAFLNPQISAAPKDSEIWAISMMMRCEWTDDEYEKEFLKLNLAAADREVKVERIFVVPREEMPGLVANSAVMAQLRNSALSTRLVDYDKLARDDVRLLGNLGSGLIAFDRRLLVLDRHGEFGEARGVGTINPDWIRTHRQYFESLRQLSSDLEGGLRTHGLDVPS